MQPRLLRGGSHGVFLQGEYYLVVSQLPLDVQETGVSEEEVGLRLEPGACVSTSGGMRRIAGWDSELR
jgi:hypothetical protein